MNLRGKGNSFMTLFIFIFYINLISRYTYFPVVASDSHIHGIGYGNQGLRPSLIVSCNDGIHFFKDLNLEFDTLYSNHNDYCEVNGSWQRSFNSMDESNTLLRKDMSLSRS